MIQKFNVMKVLGGGKFHKARTANWRFGASGGVAPQKVQWENEHLCPA